LQLPDNIDRRATREKTGVVSIGLAVGRSKIAKKCEIELFICLGLINDRPAAVVIFPLDFHIVLGKFLFKEFATVGEGRLRNSGGRRIRAGALIAGANPYDRCRTGR